MSGVRAANIGHDELQNTVISIKPSPGLDTAQVRYEDAVKTVDTLMAANNHLAAALVQKQICDQCPYSPLPLLRLLAIYRDFMRLDEGEQIADELLENFPDDARVLVEVAHFFHIDDSSERAIGYLEQVLEAEPNHLRALHLCVAIYQGKGDSKKTRQYLNRALKLAPGDPNIIFAVARETRSKGIPGYVKEVEKLVSEDRYTGKAQAVLHYAMAWFREGDVDTQFEHLDAANAIMSELSPWNRQASENALARNRRLFATADIEALQVHGDRSVQPVFIAAMPRSGTTLLEQMLGAHTDTFCVGERAAFDIAMESTRHAGNPIPTARAFTDIADYPGSIREVSQAYLTSRQIQRSGGQRTVDKSIGNWNVAGFILLAFPRAKIIHIERHPLDIIFSCYQQTFDSGHQYANRLDTLAQLYNLHRRQMDAWKSLFPDNITTLRYEDLVENQASELRRLLAFCDLPWDNRCLDYRSAMGNITTASDKQVRQPLYRKSINKWKPVEHHLAQAIAELEDSGNYELPDVPKHLASSMSANGIAPRGLLKAARTKSSVGKPEEAAEYLKRLLASEPDHPEANLRLGLILQTLAEHQQAVSHLDRALRAGVTTAPCQMALGDSLAALGRTDEAIDQLQQVVNRHPRLGAARYNLGKILQDTGEHDEAIGQYLLAIELNPNIVEFHCNLGLAYIEQRQFKQAITALERALSIDPQHVLSHYNLAMALLTSGSLATGWQEYEWRLNHPDGRVRQIPIPNWKGEPLTGKSLLVYAEQGVGDEVMFSSCLPDLLALTDKITLECEPRLAPLFERSFPGVAVKGNPKSIETDWKSLFPGVDLKVSIASLPLFFRKKEADFPSTGAYLLANRDKTQRWRNRLNQLRDTPLIGISWRGGLMPREKQVRTSALKDWLPVLENPASFVNLQYGDCTAEINQLEAETGIRVHHWEDCDPLTDLDDFFALINALDLVISIDNSTVHFAGAAGIPVWNLLPSPGEFRWMDDREDSPWYPGMRLFRQPDAGNWPKLLTQVGMELSQMLEVTTAE